MFKSVEEVAKESSGKATWIRKTLETILTRMKTIDNPFNLHIRVLLRESGDSLHLMPGRNDLQAIWHGIIQDYDIDKYSWTGLSIPEIKTILSNIPDALMELKEKYAKENKSVDLLKEIFKVN